MAKNYGIEMEEGAALAIVKAWRQANPEIVQYWYATGRAAVNATYTKKPQQCGKIFWGIRNEWLLCRLPSGRMLHYFRPELEEVEFRGRKQWKLSIECVDSYTHKWGRSPVYGGLLVENIVQGLCRDIMAEAMLRLKLHGYKIILTVHDEILAEMQKGFGSLKEFEEKMAAVPTWAEGLPINAHGWEGSFYRKG